MMRNPISFSQFPAWSRLVAIISVALVVVGCNVTKSQNYQLSDRPGFNFNRACETELGSYTLPRTVLHFKVVKTSSDFMMQTINEERVPDNRHIYCLDHLQNGFVHDVVRVFKNKVTQKEGMGETLTPAKTTGDGTIKYDKDNTPFLQLIASKAVDHTAGIIRNFIQAVFIGISGNPNFNSGQRSSNGLLAGSNDVVVADFHVDPFDHEEMGEVNQALRRFGFCAVLEGYTFNRHALSVQHYCESPARKAVDYAPRAASAIKNMRYLKPKPKSGIFYRPRAQYQLSVYVKHRPDDPGPWRLALMKTIKAENIMPIVSVGISRDAFATRRTGLVFDDGQLSNVCISKGSGVVEGIKIPLDVIYGIIALPSEIIIGTIRDRETANQLAAAQTRLIAAQNKYIEFLNTEDAAATNNQITSGDNPEGISLNLTEKVGKNIKNDVTNSVPVSAAPVGGEPTDPGNIVGTGASPILSQICARLKNATRSNLEFKEDF